MPAGTHDLAELLDLEEIDLNLYRGKQFDTDRQRVFGGQVAAQAMIAGVPPSTRRTSSTRCTPTLRPRRHPRADRVRRGADPRRPGVRHPPGRARQHGRPIFYLTANFQREEDGFEHQDVMEVPGPRRAS